MECFSYCIEVFFILPDLMSKKRYLSEEVKFELGRESCNFGLHELEVFLGLGQIGFEIIEGQLLFICL